MTTVAYFATLDNAIEGQALRTTNGTVHFLTTDTGLWTELFDQDIPRLQLHGRCDLDAAARLADGNLLHAVVRRNSHQPRVAA